MRSNERHSWIPLHYHVHPPASTFLSPVPSTQPCDETNTAAQTRTHTVRESPESWDWIKSFSPFSSSFHGFLPTEREEGRHSQSQRSEEWPSLTDCPGDWNTNQPFPAIGLGSAPAALLGQLAEAVAKKKDFTNYHCQNYRAGLKISLNMLQVCYHCICPLPGQSAKTSKIELIAKL